MYCTEQGMVQINDNQSIYTIEFGNMLIHLNERNFSVFSHFILKADEKTIQRIVCKHTNKVVLQPDKAWCNYAFTKNEFYRLQELIAGATSILNITSDINTILN